MNTSGGGHEKERDCRLFAGFKGLEVFRAEHFEADFGNEWRSVQLQITAADKKIPRRLQTSRTEFKGFYIHQLFPNAQVQFGELFFVDFAGAFVHGADGKGVFGEGDYFFN